MKVSHAKARTAHGNPHSPLPGITWVKLADVRTEAQIRKSMDPEQLQELADDIKAHGLISPLLLRRAGDHFTVIAGHRRRAACELAGLRLVPAIVGDADSDQVLELQIAENLQREDLGLDELAAVISKLYEKHASLDTVALIVNKSKAWVAKHVKFADRMSYRTRELFEKGVTEDLELLLGLEQLNQAFDRYDAGDKAFDQAVADLKEGKLTREELRNRIAAAKASHTRKAASSSTAKPARPKKEKPRTLNQLMRELEGLVYDDDKPNVEAAIQTWTDKERAIFFDSVAACYARANAIDERSPAAIAHAFHSARHYEPHQVAVALAITEKKSAPFDQAAYVDELQAFLELQLQALNKEDDTEE